MKIFKSAVFFAMRAIGIVISAVNRLLQWRHSAALFRIASAVMFITLAIGLFPAAEKASLPSVSDNRDKPLPAEEGQEAQLCIPVIYRDNVGSEWALTAARQLASELADRYGCVAELIPASQYGSDRLPDEGGAVVIGHTELSERDYVESYYSLGPDGCVTYFNSRGDLIIEAFGAVGAEAGIDRFLSNYNGDAENAVNVQNSIVMPDLDAVLTNFANGAELNFGATPTIELNSPGVISGNEAFKLMVFASPDDSQYTVRAVEALLDAEKPDLVVFCGDLSAGKEDRASLATSWETITAPLNSRGILWSFIPQSDDGNDTAALPASMINEVLSARQGCVAVDDETSLVVITDRAGIPLGGIWLVGGSRDAEELCDTLEENSALMRSAAGKDVPGVMISDGALDSAAELLNSGAVEGVRIETEWKIAGVFDTAVRSGVNCFVSSGAPQNTGTVSVDGVNCAEAGSVGFEGAGLGGRFEYNNSLRGGVLLTLSFGGDEGSFTAKYVYTADYGVNHR